MQWGEGWFAVTPGGGRPILVSTRDPVADQINSVVVATLTRTRRGLLSEFDLSADVDGVPSDGVVTFDNVHTSPREAFRHRVASLSARRLVDVCRVLAAATGC